MIVRDRKKLELLQVLDPAHVSQTDGRSPVTRVRLAGQGERVVGQLAQNWGRHCNAAAKMRGPGSLVGLFLRRSMPSVDRAARKIEGRLKCQLRYVAFRAGSLSRSAKPCGGRDCDADRIHLADGSFLGPDGGAAGSQSPSASEGQRQSEEAPYSTNKLSSSGQK